MRQLETLESRMLLSASAMPAALSTQVVMSPQTSYLLDKHGTLQIKASGDVYAKVGTVTKRGNVEVQIADDSGASADLHGVSSVTILETGSNQTIAWQATGVDATLFAAGDHDSVFVDDLGNDHTTILVSGVGSNVVLDGSGSDLAFATGNRLTNNDTLNIDGTFKTTTFGFETVHQNGPLPSSMAMNSALPAASADKLRHLFAHPHR